MTFTDGSRLDPGRVRAGRGRAAVGIAVGGLLAAAAIVVAAVTLGGPPNARTGLMATAGVAPVDLTEPGDLEERCQTPADAAASPDCRLVGTVSALDAYWADALPAAGLAFDHAGITFLDGEVETPCGPASSATGPVYCPTDTRLYLEVGFFDALDREEDGTLAQAYVAAHEYGHHIVELAGALEPQESDQVEVELMADCLAGVWAGHAATVPDASGAPLLKPITDESLARALATAEAVGEARIEEPGDGEAAPHTFAHGSADARGAAFTTGYENGTLASCELAGIAER